MAITLKDLLAGQARLSEKEKMAGTKERMSMDEFKQIAAAGGTNVMAEELKKHTGLLKVIADKKDTTRKGPDDTAKAEVDQEARTIEEGKVKLLSKIEENTRKDREAKKEEKKEDDGLGLPLAIVGIAAALGSLAGVLKAYVKTVKLFAEALAPIGKGLLKGLKLFAEFLIDLAPEKLITGIKKAISSFAAGISMQFDLLKSNVISAVQKVESFVVGIFDAIKVAAAKFTEFVVKGFESIKSAIGIGEGSQLGKTIASVFEGFKTVLGKFITPFTDAFSLIKDLTEGPIGKAVGYMTEVFTKLKQPFVELGAGIVKFGKMFGFVANIVEKLAMPLMIVMTVWDTVKGAIEGYEKEGIVGAISGAIKGLIESLITAPIDMLKDAASWILEQFGFEDASKYLESFSVTDMMKGFVDAIFHPVDTIRSMFEGVAAFFEGIEIPKIGFTIPIINKEVSIGPFYPFKSDKPAEAKVDGGSTSSAAATPAVPAGRPGSPSANIAARQAAAASQETPVTADAAQRQKYYAEKGFTPEQIKTLEERRAKIDAVRAQDPNKGIDAELAMYEERGAKADAKLKAAGVQPMTIPPVQAGAVYDQSAQNASMVSGSGVSQNIVVAPTNVTNNKTQLPQLRVEPRNTESTFGRLSERMFAPI